MLSKMNTESAINVLNIVYFINKCKLVIVWVYGIGIGNHMKAN